MKTYGCDDCDYLQRHRCKLWEIKIDDPHNSHCACLSHGLREAAREAKAKKTK